MLATRIYIEVQQNSDGRTKTYYFNYANDIQIQSSWETYTDTCKISLPNKFKENNETIVAALINLSVSVNSLIDCNLYPNKFNSELKSKEILFIIHKYSLQTKNPS